MVHDEEDKKFSFQTQVEVESFCFLATFSLFSLFSHDQQGLITIKMWVSKLFWMFFNHILRLESICPC